MSDPTHDEKLRALAEKIEAELFVDLDRFGAIERIRKLIQDTFPDEKITIIQDDFVDG